MSEPFAAPAVARSAVSIVPAAAQADQAPGNVGGMLMAGLFLVVLGLAGVAVWRSDLVSGVADLGSDSGEAATVESTTEPSTADRPETGPAPGAESGASAGSESEAAEKSDSEIVTDILEDNDGRMKQAKIVDETGWSKSKVSMVLSDMEDEGDISKLRVGRENIISLSGNEPEAAGSPFDDE